MDANPNPVRELIPIFEADLGSLQRLFSIKISVQREARLRLLFEEWLERLEGIEFNELDLNGKIDFILLRNVLQRELRQLEIDRLAIESIKPLVPFAEGVIELEEARGRFEPIDPREAAVTLNSLAAILRGLIDDVGAIQATKSEGNQAAETTKALRKHLESWFEFHNGYHPMFTWWAGSPYQEVDELLGRYVDALKEKLVGVAPDDDQAIVGKPIGRDALLAELQFEMIPYSPEELIGIADREFAWCENEMRRASEELGFGSEWREALEHVKGLHVDPGKQPELVRELALEAVAFLEERELLTIPDLAKETWRMEMMPPEKQLVNPFFLGGETIIVSFPTHTMPHGQKLMSLRGNNRHFARATVQHELIPGHHMQFFMCPRHKPYRSLFSTPFWTEGWALHWEMLLWDLGFPQGPEDRIGMLFWRMHRCARIIFSLRFHLGEMSPEECIDFLVERVGHERMNAEGEVRRSFSGAYPPLYQLAYMIGGLQFRAMHGELVGSGRLSNREFHDAIMHENNMPPEALRMLLKGEHPAKNFESSWRFAD
jgi:uncharacterized protein (DUF885 family)